MIRDIETLWEQMEYLRDIMGKDLLLHEIMKSMSDKELQETIDYIARNHDIEL